MTSFKYYDSFKAYYREWLSGMDSSNIVDYERNLSALIEFNSLLVEVCA